MSFNEIVAALNSTAAVFAPALSVLPVQPGTPDTVVIAFTSAVLFGEFVEANAATGRTRVYFYDPILNLWRDLWVDSALVTVIIPGGALWVRSLFSAEVQ